jgi:hypothetical protein
MEGTQESCYSSVQLRGYMAKQTTSFFFILFLLLLSINPDRLLLQLID